jgi:hypothetical protein
MQDITRQRDLAKMLLQKGLTDNLQGQMVSGRYVGASPWEGIAKVYNAYSGRQMAKEADKKQAQLAEMLRAEGDKDLMAYRQAVTPTPAVEAKPEFIPQGQTMLDDQGMPTMGYQAPVQAVPEKKADYDLGISILRKSKDPETRQLAKMLMAEQLKTIVAPEGSTIYRGGIGGAGETIKGSPKQTELMRDYNFAKTPEGGGFKGLFTDYDLMRRNASSQKINVNNEQTYGGALAKGAADQDLALKSVADNASTVVSNVARQKKILESGNLFTGKTANVQQELASYADAIGLGGKDTATKASNTQSAISGLATVTLDSIKTSGLGAGQGFTDKDREFLQDAKSGRITWNKESIKRVYDLQEQVAIASAKKWNQRIKQLPASAIKPLGWGEVQVPTAYGTSNVRNEADAILNGSQDGSQR